VGVKKREPPPPPNNQTSNSTQSNSESEKELSRLVSTVRQFKSTVRNYKDNAQVQGSEKLVITHGLDPDSANFVIEAVLNYDYDRGTSQHDHHCIKRDSILFPGIIFPSTTGLVGDADMVKVYDFFAAYCDSLIGKQNNGNGNGNANGSDNGNGNGDEIKVIDLVTIFNTTGGMGFYANIITIINQKPQYPFDPNCNPISNNAMWSQMFSCTQPVSFDGPTLFTNRLNCLNPNLHGCFGGYVIYSNVQTKNFYSYVNPSIGYVLSNAPTCNNTVLTPATMNGYVTPAINLVVANTPSWGGPLPFFTVANYFCDSYAVGAPITDWWRIHATYARAWCSIQYYPQYIP
jgi:hypothetical protein